MLVRGFVVRHAVATAAPETQLLTFLPRFPRAAAHGMKPSKKVVFVVPGRVLLEHSLPLLDVKRHG